MKKAFVSRKDRWPFFFDGGGTRHKAQGTTIRMMMLVNTIHVALDF
jgi:hypothetical protein